MVDLHTRGKVIYGCFTWLHVRFRSARTGATPAKGVAAVWPGLHPLPGKVRASLNSGTRFG